MPNFTDDDIEKLIQIAETRGQDDPYSSVNKKSGALGKYQLLKTYHKEPIEKRYNIPFEDIVKYPEYQDDYFKNVLLPGYKKSTAEIKKSVPQSKKIDELALTAMQQLGPGNVRKYLENTADENVKNQIEHFLRTTEEYKKQKERQQATDQYRQSFSKLKDLMSTQSRNVASEEE